MRYLELALALALGLVAVALADAQTTTYPRDITGTPAAECAALDAGGTPRLCGPTNPLPTSDVNVSLGCAGQTLASTTDTSINLAASGQVITGVANQRVHICHITLIATGGANNVAIVEGTGATCGTGTAGLYGGTTAATGLGFAAQGGFVAGDGAHVIRRLAVTGDNLCLILSAATQVSGTIRWASF